VKHKVFGKIHGEIGPQNQSESESFGAGMACTCRARQELYPGSKRPA